MLTRKIGKLLLGKSTPFHLVTACVLGGWIAFAPGIGQAPALYVVLAALVCLLPVNMGLMSVTALVLYPVNLLVLPATFQVGRILLDGPTRPLFSALINTPFTALMGFEYYTGTGGFLVGGLFGGFVGWLMVRLVRTIRRRLRDADTNSETYRRWASRWWVRLGSWLVLGAKPSPAEYEKLEGRRIGKPVRPLGIVVAIVVVGAFVGLGQLLSGPFLTRALQAALERVNGATVDLAKAEIRLDEGRVVIDGLAMADPEKLETDVFRTVRIEADVSASDLLTRRLHIDSLVVTDSSSGKTREKPGRLTGTQATPKDVPVEDEDAKTLDDYLKDAREWRERLAQVRRWLDRLTGQPDPEAAPTDKEREQREEGLQEKLERQARELGYARVAAEHLITGRPRLSIGELKIEGLQAMQLGGKAIDIVGSNLSTHPYLVDEPPRLSIRARDGTVLFDVTLAGASKRGGENKIELVYKGLPGDAIGQRLKGEPIKGGTIDFEAKGTWQLGGKIDLPFQVRLNGTTLTLPGSGKSEKIDRLDLPLRIYGPLDDPRVLFREKDLANALVAAGKKELAGRLGAELDKKLGDDVKKKLGDLFK